MFIWWIISNILLNFVACWFINPSRKYRILSQFCQVHITEPYDELIISKYVFKIHNLSTSTFHDCLGKKSVNKLKKPTGNNKNIKLCTYFQSAFTKVLFIVRYTETNNYPHFFSPFEVNINKNRWEMGLLSFSNLEICIKKTEFSGFKGKNRI